MNGVMTPGVSAGSNQVGARDTCTAIVSWPSGAAGTGAGTASATARARRATEAGEKRRTFTVSSCLYLSSESCWRAYGFWSGEASTAAAYTVRERPYNSAHEHIGDSPRRARRSRGHGPAPPPYPPPAGGWPLGTAHA